MRSFLQAQVITCTLLLGFLNHGLADRISVDKNCHKENETISITFDDKTPRIGKWIGVYGEDDGTFDASADPLLWLWTCGSQECDRTMESGVVTFGAENVTDHLLTWPLMSGTYVAVLAHDSQSRRTVSAMSETIIVSDTCLPSQAPSNNTNTTLAPSTVLFTIFVHKGCHEVNTDISISYENNDPSIGDWVGIYWDTTGYSNDMGEPVMWVWTCGSQTCNSLNGNATVVFGEGQTGDHLFRWPLIAGNYIAVLARDAQPMQVLAMSEPFSVGACFTSSPVSLEHISTNPSNFPGIVPSNGPSWFPTSSTLSPSMPSDQLSNENDNKGLDRTSARDFLDSQQITHIEIVKRCYKVNTTIKITFTSAFQEYYDWVGIYPSDFDSILDSSTPVWQGICDQGSCSETYVDFNSSHMKLLLEKGSYKAAFGTSTNPEVIFAETSIFEIADECFMLSRHNPLKTELNEASDFTVIDIDRVSKLVRDAPRSHSGMSIASQIRALEAVLEFNPITLLNMDDDEILQMYALLCIYFATNSVETEITKKVFGPGAPPPWKNSRLWASTYIPPCGGWFGVICDSNKHVTEIKLKSNGLSGSFPSDVTLIKSLVALDIRENALLNQGEDGNKWLGDLVDALSKNICILEKPFLNMMVFLQKLVNYQS